MVELKTGITLKFPSNNLNNTSFRDQKDHIDVIMTLNGENAYLQISNNPNVGMSFFDKSWKQIWRTALKSDLTDIIMVKSFQGTSITIAENASQKVSIPISTPIGYKVVGKISERWNGGPEMYLSQVDLTPTTFTGYAANLRNSEATSIPTISVLFVKS